MRLTLNLRPRLSVSARLSSGISGSVLDSWMTSFLADFLLDFSSFLFSGRSSMSSFSCSC
jgi:hypothetical protein